MHSKFGIFCNKFKEQTLNENVITKNGYTDRIIKLAWGDFSPAVQMERENKNVKEKKIDQKPSKWHRFFFFSLASFARILQLLLLFLSPYLSLAL